MELALQRWQLETEDGTADVDQTGLVLNALNIYNREGWFSPYIIAGLGFVNDDAGGAAGDEDNFQAQAGVGSFWNILGDRVALGLDPRAIDRDSSTLWCEDRDGKPVVLFKSEWAFNWLAEKNPKVQFREAAL